MSRTPEFTAQLAPLKDAQKNAFEAKREAYRKSQARQKLSRGLNQTTRHLDGTEAESLREAGAQAQTDAVGAWSAFNQSHFEQLDILTVLEPMLDPRQNASQLNDAYPILMMPLRIETRFVPDEPELWIRIYPDAWAVDGFEEILSEVEVRNAQSFWADYWAAGDVREARIAAWRNLVANHGSGRSRWITMTYRPANEPDQPTTIAVGEMILIVGGPRPADDEATAINAYWQDVWRNSTDSVAADTAFDKLKTAIGEPAAKLAATQIPHRLGDPFSGPDRNLITVKTVWIEWPELADEEVKATGWSEAARTDVLPERLVVTLQVGDSTRSEIGKVIPSTVTLGFDPSAPDAEQIRQENGELVLPDAMAWIFDFDKAIEMGLGFKIALSTAERRSGFDRILVAGLSLRDDADESKVMLERLFSHHQNSHSGISLLPQGTPSNNTETPSGYAEEEELEASFSRIFDGELPDLSLTDSTKKLDGQWLAEWLGIDKDLVASLPHADGKDQCEGRAINRVLWPATIGYTLDTMMDGVLDEGALSRTRRYFESYVLARDCVPQIRIDDQPYGILPASAWSKHSWFNLRRDDNNDNDPNFTLNRALVTFMSSQFGSAGYLAQLFDILTKADAQWAALVSDTSHVGQEGDLHQTLLKVLGLAPNSLEFYRRNADSLEHYFNLLNAQGLGGMFANIRAWMHTQSGLGLLSQLGHNAKETPEILRFVFKDDEEALRKILIDDVELSETNPVRSYTDDGENYLEWLITAGQTSLEALRTQNGFTGDEIPSALFYHMARHALQLSNWDVGMRLHAGLADPVLSPTDLREARRDAPFLHIQESVQTSSSRYFHLYQPAQAITGSNDLLLQDHIAQVWPVAPEARQYRNILGALEHLKDTPTARLERLLIEHLDLCTYRLDAWKQGVLQLQLEFMRHHHPSHPAQPDVGVVAPPEIDTSTKGQGIYLGAYGWMENIRPRNNNLSPADVPTDLQAAFDADDRPMVDDPENLGYIHAPSLDQAQTAAVLRSTYVNSADDENPETMAINLSSWRVRQAMAVLEGLRNDQSLGELLGYRLERELHENFQIAETDQFIFALRKHFPLVANHLSETYEDLPAGESIETIEARNVVDGEAMLKHIEDTGNTSYPFGLTDMPTATGPQSDAIENSVDLLRNVNDAVADLSVAESVHQAMKGKPDSAAAVLDAQGSGLLPPVSEFVATPREGITITLRNAIFMDAAPPATQAWTTVAASPRGEAEPVLDHWLASLFPAPDNIVVQVHNARTDGVTDISLEELGRQPIDWLYDLRLDDREAMTSLDQIIEQHYRTANAPIAADDILSIRYQTDIAGKISLFQFAPLVDAARNIVATTRPLKASDIALNNDPTAERTGAETLPKLRVKDALVSLTALDSDARAFLTPIDNDLDDITANAASLRSNLKNRFSDFQNLTRRAVLFGLKELDGSIATRWNRGWFDRLNKPLNETIADWERRLHDFHGFVGRFDSVPPSAPFNSAFRPLQRAERQISTQITTPLPDDPLTMRTDLAARATAFESRLDELRALWTVVTDDANLYLTQLEASLPLTDFVPEDFDVSAANSAFATATTEIAAGIRALLLAIKSRTLAAQQKLDAHDAAIEQQKKVKHIGEALKEIFGEDFVSLPSFVFTPEQQDELQRCETDKDNLLRYQRDTLGDIAPMDSWLHSSARVRSRMATFEYLSMAHEALTGGELTFDAWQLPHAREDHWVGAAYPNDYEITGDRLLVQSYRKDAFVAGSPQVGLLLDEWTEVIPTPDITTGVAFHFDQPNSEPPQTFLLMTPTDFRGGWLWSDIIDGLNETLDAAKKRAVEPEHIDSTPYALFLPATLASTMHHPLSISLNYAAVNDYARAVVQETE